MRSDPPQPPHAGQRSQRGGGQDLGDGGALLKAAAQSKPTEEQWQTMLDAARLLTEINGLDDMVLTAKAPSGGFLNIQELVPAGHRPGSDSRQAARGPYRPPVKPPSPSPGRSPESPKRCSGPHAAPLKALPAQGPGIPNR